MNSVSINKIVKLISDNIVDITDKFIYEKEFIECNLSGIFKPVRPEMREISNIKIADKNFLLKKINVNDSIKFEKNAVFEYNRSPARLYVDIFKKASNLVYLKAKFRGTGIFRIKIFSEDVKTKKLIHEEIVNFCDNSEYKTISFDLNSIKSNSSLFTNVECLSDIGQIYNFRWLGYVHKNLANTGQRIVLIRIYGNKSTVFENLRNIILVEDINSILKKFLFVIYDANEFDEGINLINEFNSIKTIYIKGKNFGGGGNASLLMSIVSRINKNISEIILIDDDCKLEPETFIRHDAFVTCRKENIYSTSPVYSSDDPSIIQEFGAFWGEFFSFRNNAIVVQTKREKSLLPYLVRNSRNINTEYDVKYIACHQNFEFATFIFISFPFKIMKKAISIPFFLRNDDVEICLRLNNLGFENTINPNLFVWHGRSHSIVSEFYTIFHALIVNNMYGGLNKQYLYTIFMERISRFSKIGNLLLLYVYYLTIKNFVDFNSWTDSSKYFENYHKIKNKIINIQRLVLKRIPFEVIDVNRENFSIVGLIDINPAVPKNQKIIFYDHLNDIYYSQEEYLDKNINTLSLLEESIHCLSSLIEKFDIISINWKLFIRNFNHILFWNKVTHEYPFERLYYNIPKYYTRGNNKKSESFKYIFSSKDTILPFDFDPEMYLKKNLDVKESKKNPIEHWIKNGKKENRRY